jgi:hypothetical protein
MTVDPGLEVELKAKLKLLNEQLWEGRCGERDIDSWLKNYTGLVLDPSEEQIHALYLLSNLTYFGRREIRIMLQSMYRDLFQYPLTRSLRSGASNTTDWNVIAGLFQNELKRTRFLGMGNPAESGTHLLYYFRQENQLHKDQFVGHHQILTSSARSNSADFREPDVTRYVFIDDVCGSGQQCITYSNTLLADLKHVAAAKNRAIEFQYLVLFATEIGLENARNKTDFDTVEAVHVLDDSYKAFDTNSRIYKKPPAEISRAIAHNIFLKYGSMLDVNHPLGYAGGQLLLAFSHNIPDNTLPVIWFDDDPSKWTAILPRYPKMGA